MLIVCNFYHITQETPRGTLYLVTNGVTSSWTNKINGATKIFPRCIREIESQYKNPNVKTIYMSGVWSTYDKNVLGVNDD